MTAVVNDKLSLDSELIIFNSDNNSQLEVPLVEYGIDAGFPSPAIDFTNLSTIDLNKHLIKNKSSTFYGQVKGYSMKDCGIEDGDLLVIDKSINAKNNQIAVCYIDGKFTLKRVVLGENKCLLVPANSDYKAIEVTADNDFMIWGIVTYIIKKIK